MPPHFLGLVFVWIIDNGIVNRKRMAAGLSHKLEGSSVALMVEDGNRYG
jgi:hypothetical protein